jgi:hypothetical protein
MANSVFYKSGLGQKDRGGQWPFSFCTCPLWLNVQIFGYDAKARFPLRGQSEACFSMKQVEDVRQWRFKSRRLGMSKRTRSRWLKLSQPCEHSVQSRYRAISLQGRFIVNWNGSRDPNILGDGRRCRMKGAVASIMRTMANIEWYE